MRRAIPLVSSTRGAVVLVPAYLWAVLGAIMLAACVLVGGWSEPAKAAPPAQYSITDLGTLPGGSDSQPSAINDLGQVVGNSRTASGDTHPVLWENGRITDLGGTLPVGDSGIATDINDRGHVVGTSDTASGGFHAVLWKNGRMTDLGTLPGASFSQAIGINDLGQVVGQSETASGEFHAVLWTK